MDVITPAHIPNNRREVCSQFGFDERFVEGRVWPRDHQRRQQAESESFKCISDAKEKNNNKKKKPPIFTVRNTMGESMLKL